MTPGSSAFIIARDPSRAIRRGRQLFQRKFTGRPGRRPADAATASATSTTTGAHRRRPRRQLRRLPRPAARRGRLRRRRRHAARQPRRAAPVRPRPEGDARRRDHRRPARDPRAGARAGARATAAPSRCALVSKGIALRRDHGAARRHRRHLAVSRASIPTCACGRSSRTAGRSRSASSSSARCNDEMGLQAVDPLTSPAAAAGGRVVTPARHGARRRARQDRGAGRRRTPTDDPDGDGVAQRDPDARWSTTSSSTCSTTSSRRPTGRPRPREPGRASSSAIGCAGCHVADLPIDHDRRVADVETVYDPQRGIFNHLFATATLLFDASRRRLGLSRR